MMDIVERLRGAPNVMTENGYTSISKMGGAMLNEAADEIERLRGIINDDRLEGAANEIERLQKALREICEVYAGSEGIPQPMTAAEGYLLSLFMEAVRIAQEALKEGE